MDRNPTAALSYSAEINRRNFLHLFPRVGIKPKLCTVFPQLIGSQVLRSTGFSRLYILFVGLHWPSLQQLILGFTRDFTG